MKRISIKSLHFPVSLLLLLSGCAALEPRGDIDWSLFDASVPPPTGRILAGRSEEPSPPRASRTAEDESRWGSETRSGRGYQSPAYRNLNTRAELQRAWEEETAQAELELGMTMGEVRSLWGAPIEVEVAGEPEHGNQQWVYSIRSSRYSTGPGPKVVYFEGYRVAGWRLQ